MINLERFELQNGLRLVVHEDKSTPMVSVCVTYGVGSKHEQRDKTGYAHLFEHLMFGGSVHAPDFDRYIQQAGGDNNAFTNQDMTVYYESLPAPNLEVALWLEADRMCALQLTEALLEKEKKIVLEEFKESCLNRPYGDIWHHIGSLVYHKHPYQVPTIGARMSHIAGATLADIQAFWERFYCPNNAVIGIAGNVSPSTAFAYVKKWFGSINSKSITYPPITPEPPQTQKRLLCLESNVPVDAFYMVFRGAARKQFDYYLDDFITDVLAEGEAANLHQNLVNEQELFSDIDAYITASIDPGLIVVEGHLAERTTYEQAEKAVWEELNVLKNSLLSDKAVQKLQHRIEHNLEFSKVNHLHKALNLAYYEMLGNAEWINQEKEKYQQITAHDIQQRCQAVFQRTNCSIIQYKSLVNAE